MMSVQSVLSKTSRWLGGAALAGSLFFALPAQAASPQRPTSDRDADRQRQAYDQPRFDVRRLDDAVRDARAAADAARDSGDRQLANRMSTFAKKMADLRERVEDRHASPDRVNHDLQKLDDDSRKIQREAARNGRTDPAVMDSWDRVVRVVDDMRRGDLGRRGTSGRLRDDERPTDRDRDRDLDRDRDRDQYRTDRDDQQAPLPDQLDRHVRRAETLADQLDIGDARSSVEHFAGRASKFGNDFNGLSPEDRQEQARSLMEEAREVQQSLTKHNASPQLIDEWNGVIDVLERMGGRR